MYLAAILLVLSSCSGEQTKTETKTRNLEAENKVTLTADQRKNAGIETGSINKRTMAGTLRLNGKIDVPPQNMVSISVPLGGYLKSTKLLPGMHVKKGETIATVEDPVYIQLQQDYLTAKARLVFLEKEYQRQRELNQSKAASDKVSQQAEADYLSNKILVTSLFEKLQMIGINPASISENHILKSVYITSPINGFVSKVNVNIGKYVSPTDVLFELVNPEDIHLSLKVFEKDLSKLYIGQQVMAYNNNQPDTKHLCKILLIGHDLSADRSADVHCHFEDYDKTLVPGTYMNAEVQIKSAETATLPEDAIVEFEGKAYAFIATSDGNYEMIEVQTGNSTDGHVQIESPTLEHKEIVLKGAYSLLMMLKNKAE
jgi:cobalt-zinc-cadmium efflux system membrane fusion protein